MKCIMDAYDVLMQATDLSPRNGKINTVLTALVNAASDSYSRNEEKQVLNDPRLKAMQARLLEKLAQAECRMEEYWAQYFCSIEKLDKGKLQSFWYWDNYEKLTDGEVAFFPEQDFSESESIAFVGSGPLPLTAIIMHYKTGKPVTCIDSDPDAVMFSRRLLEKAGLSDKIKVVSADGASYDYRNNPVVIVASLVGDKSKVIEQINHTRNDCFLGLRSAERLHTILYEPVNTKSQSLESMTFSGKTPHDPVTINTTLFYKASKTRHGANTHNLK